MDALWAGCSLLAADVPLTVGEGPWAWVLPLVTLTAMEIVLGIDNIVFITILVAKLPAAEQPRGRLIGLALALGMRLALLFSITWIMALDQPLFAWTALGIPAEWLSTAARDVSARDLILLAGGLFLIGKATYEIHHRLEGPGPHEAATQPPASITAVIVQIALLDLVFSIDSVITAVGMAQHIWIMVVAVVLSMGVMLAFAGPIGRFVTRHPTLKMLALAFLILIGVMLMAEGMGTHIDRGYVYFAMAFSLGVELLNMRARRAAEPVQLRGPRAA